MVRMQYNQSKHVPGYGWNHSILTALLDHIVRSYRVDIDRIHVTGFSMGMQNLPHSCRLPSSRPLSTLFLQAVTEPGTSLSRPPTASHP